MIIVTPSRGFLKVPVDGVGLDIQAGAVLSPGTVNTDSTAKTLGTFGLSVATGVDALGLLVSLHDFSVTGDTDTDSGSAHVLREVDPFYPGCLVAAEYDQTDTMAVASATSTVATVSSIEDNIDGGWLYVVSGTGIGQLLFIMDSAAGTAGYVSASTTTLDNTSTLIKILPISHSLLKMNATCDKLGTDAAAGTWTCKVVRNQMKYAGQEGWIDLDPKAHHNLQLNGLSPVFRSIVSPVNTFFAPID